MAKGKQSGTGGESDDKGSEKATGTGRELAEIARRGQRGDLNTRDLEAIRAMIAEVEALEVEDRVTATALRNLRVADTQLRALLARISDGRIDDAAFAELPEHLRRQIITRLENNVTRMRNALARATEAQEVSPSFKCIEEYERCKARSPSSPIWCHIAMTICQIRALGGILKAMAGKAQK